MENETETCYQLRRIADALEQLNLIQNTKQKNVPVEEVKTPKQYETKCSDCGKITQVPFEPNPKWPVRCKECFVKFKNK